MRLSKRKKYDNYSVVYYSEDKQIHSNIITDFCTSLFLCMMWNYGEDW